jgi:hypothetical protein
VLVRHHSTWQPGPAETAAEGGAGRRSAKIAAAPINQSREAHHPARPLHSPEGSPEGWLQRKHSSNLCTATPWRTADLC